MDKPTRLLRINRWLTRPLQVLTVLSVIIAFGQTALASPFGQGYFGSNSPFGAETSITISLGSGANLSLTPSGANFYGTASSSVTVSSTDVNGYNLYIYSAGSSSLAHGSTSIPASANTTESALATNTWGYNTDASSNFIGPTTSPVLLTSSSGPNVSGTTTTITFGALTSIITAEGVYTGNVTFTAVAPDI
jgi:hypothetical protein